ncbi:MAG: Rpn family recombination-promoting nuclease/putative transposase [Kofleriaceae bacterium]
MHASPHDALVKAVFGQPEHAAGVLRTIVPSEVGEAIEWRTLTLCPGSFIDAVLAYQHSDLLFAARWRAGHKALLYFLLEHQSSPSTGEPMAFRMLRYQLRIWERWLADHPKARTLPVIVPLVLYHGAARWSEVPAFEDLLELPLALRPALEPYLVRSSYLLHDLSNYSEDELLTMRWHTAVAKVATVLLQQARADIDLVALLARWLGPLREVASSPTGRDALAQLLRYILEVHERTTPDALQTLLERELGPRAKESLMTAAQRLREEGRQEGHREGRQEGHREGRLEASRALLSRILQQRFGAQLDPSVEQRLHAATLEQVEAWSSRVLTAASLAAVFDDDLHSDR